MSDLNKARRTDATIHFAGVDISEEIRPYLLSLTYTDNEEDEVDDLQIKLHDRDGIWLTSWLNQVVDAASNGTDPQADNGTSYMVTAKSGLNIRSGPSTSYSRYGYLTYGTVVSITGTTGDWSIFSYNGKTAYLHSAYLMALSNNASSVATVKYGSTGDDVMLMQQYLLTLGYALPRYGVDGIFAGETLEAVKKFQSDNGLTPDGICGATTWAALFAAVNDLSGNKSAQTQSGFLISAAIVSQNVESDGTDSVLSCGQFELDDIDASGPPSVVTIKATALPYSATMRKTKKNKAWENYYLSGIVADMASSNGMAYMFLCDDDPFYSRVEQVKMADIEFLSTLCHNAGISLKVSDNIVILFDQATYEANDSVMTIKHGESNISKYKLNIGEADTQYDYCRVRYVVPSTGKVITGYAYAESYDEDSDDNQRLDVSAVVSNTKDAERLAAKRLRLANKYAKSASFTLAGDVNLVAGVTIELEGFGLFTGKYIVKQAKHTVGGSGYTVQIKLRPVME